MSSQGGESDHRSAFPIKCKGVPTLTYQEKNRLKSDTKKPAEKLGKSNLTRAKNKSPTSAQVVDTDVCNNNIDSKCTTNSDRHESELISLSHFFHIEQSATKSTGRMQSGKLQPPRTPLISSKMLKLKKTKCPVQLSGMNLIWQWISGRTELFNTHFSASDYHEH